MCYVLAVYFLFRCLILVKMQDSLGLFKENLEVILDDLIKKKKGKMD